jgi:hypothetical protein
MNSKSENRQLSQYEKAIQRIRIGIALTFAIAAVGLISSMYAFRNTEYFQMVTGLFTFILLACLFCVFLLFVEQLFVGAIRRVKSQFSIRFMLILTTGIAVVAALASYHVGLAIGFLFFLFLFLALGSESLRSKESSIQSEAHRQQEGQST